MGHSVGLTPGLTPVSKRDAQAAAHRLRRRPFTRCSVAGDRREAIVVDDEDRQRFIHALGAALHEMRLAGPRLGADDQPLPPCPGDAAGPARVSPIISHWHLRPTAGAGHAYPHGPQDTSRVPQGLGAGGAGSAQ